jgi:O-antigen ligase
LRNAAHALLYALLPAAATAGGLARAPGLAVAGALSVRPATLQRGLSFEYPAAGIILVFVLWAALSALWSPFPDHGQALRLVAITVTGLAFVAAAGDAGRLTRAAGLAAISVLIVLLALEAAFAMPLNSLAQPDAPVWQVARNPGRGVSVLVVIVWGAAAALLSRRSPTAGFGAGALLLATFMLAAQFMQSANLVAAVIGLVAFAGGWFLPALVLRIITWGLALWTLIAPLAALALVADRAWLANAPLSLAIRVETWAYATKRIFEHPIFGHGLDAAREMSEPIVLRGAHEDLMPLHPHSASLHIWMETGAIGAVLIAAALAFAGRDMARALHADRAAAAAACASMAAFGVLANSTYGAWQEWWIATACVAAALICAIRSAFSPT